MATKTTVRIVSETTSTASSVKAPAEPPAKADTAEDLRRRRAGIACFL